MNIGQTKYLLDANVFIQAKRSYYAFSICPGFWESLVDASKNEIICTITPVKTELEAGKDELAQWVGDSVPGDFFKSTDAPEISSKYREVMRWVEGNSQFYQLAKDEFAAGADGWLIAYAAVRDITLVTQEELRPQARNRIPLPNVAQQFNVTWLSTFKMLEALNIQYIWRGETL